MTNYEKYKNEIIESLLNRDPCRFIGEYWGKEHCWRRMDPNDVGTSITCVDCLKGFNKWLNEEHKIDWSKVAVDTPIIVKQYNWPECKRHFAKYENGSIYYWADGYTSYTTTECVRINSYDKVELANLEYSNELDYSKNKLNTKIKAYWKKVHPVQDNDCGGYECSVCLTGLWNIDGFKYCPYCGSEMEKIK